MFSFFFYLHLHFNLQFEWSVAVLLIESLICHNFSASSISFGCSFVFRFDLFRNLHFFPWCKVRHFKRISASLTPFSHCLNYKRIKKKNEICLSGSSDVIPLGPSHAKLAIFHHKQSRESPLHLLFLSYLSLLFNRDIECIKSWKTSVVLTFSFVMTVEIE